MNSNLRDRILQKLDTLGDERGYQVLDYVDFLESRYAEKSSAPASVFQKFTEGVEGRMRAGGVAATTVAETMGLLNKAVGVLGGVAAAGMSVATDVAAAGKTVAEDVASAAQRIVSVPTPSTSQAQSEVHVSPNSEAKVGDSV